MVKLLVIADDFTGALDTGVQFRAKNSMVLVHKRGDQSLRDILEKDMQVLIVDAETRHMSPDEAFQIVYDIVDTAVTLGVSYIYKKTDSGMRGNIGSELTAFLRASKSSRIHYIPAFPQMGRITVNGIHYVNGVPVSESIFGTDLFEPVRKSAVKEIIAEQSDVMVYQMGKSTANWTAKGILVYDSATEEEMLRLALELKEKSQLHLLAGCAGLAAILFGMLGLQTVRPVLPDFNENLLTICGSTNSVTVRQLDCASSAGMKRICLSPEQKLKKNWPDSEEGRAFIDGWKKNMCAGGNTIIECGVHDLERTSAYMRRKNIDLTEARYRIADTMGGVLKRLLDCGLQSTLLVTGGDTLLAFMQRIRQNTLVPICELLSGVVLSRFEYNGNMYNLLSKSGGFGQEDLLLTLTELIKEEYAGETVNN